MSSNIDKLPSWLDLGYDGDRPYVYHYTTKDVLLTGILNNLSLKISPLVGANDPYEFLPWKFIGMGTHNPKRDQLLIARSSMNLQSYKLKCSFVSFSSDKDDVYGSEIEGRGFAHPHMWSYYSEVHTGVVLVFDKEKLFEKIQTELSNQSEKVFAGFVDYGDISNITKSEYKIDLDRADDLGVENYASEHFWNHVDKLLFKKHVDWIHEQEYRIVVVGEDSTEYFVNLEGTLEGIVFGCKYPYRDVTDYSAIRNLLTPHLYDLVWSGGNQMIYSIET